MDGSVALPLPVARSYGGRAAGRTAVATSTGRARRVQWAVEDALSLASSSARGLDVHARDPRAFEAAKYHLERSHPVSDLSGRVLAVTAAPLETSRSLMLGRNPGELTRHNTSPLYRPEYSTVVAIPEKASEMGMCTYHDGAGVQRGDDVLSTFPELHSWSGSGASFPTVDEYRTSSPRWRESSPVRNRSDEPDCPAGSVVHSPSPLKIVTSNAAMVNMKSGLYNGRASPTGGARGMLTASATVLGRKHPGDRISWDYPQELSTREKMRGNYPTLNRARSVDSSEPGGGGLYHAELFHCPGSNNMSGTTIASTSSTSTLPPASEPAEISSHKRRCFSFGDLPGHTSDIVMDDSAVPESKKGVRGKNKRRCTQVYITRHVEEVLRRQEFILKFVRALIMFGAPSHRMQSQILSTARVLDIEMSCFYLPDAMLISFEDPATGTSSIKFVRQGSALNINKLQEVHEIYWNVIHDELSVKDASLELGRAMDEKAVYKGWQLVLVGSLCSAAICSVSFYGSFIDCLASCILGAILVTVQLRSASHELYSHIFELSITTLLSFIAAALGSTGYFCYSAVVSGAIVLILPGYIVLCGSLDVTSRNPLSGAVRLCFALVYSLLLGFGLAIGAVVFQAICHSKMVPHELDDYQCIQSHDVDGVWWQKTASGWWSFLTVPLYSICLSLRFHASYKRKEFFLLIAISCIGWVTTHFSSLAFHSRSDMSAAVGAFTVGLIANIYGRLFNGNAFVVMITGILFQVPSGLANGGGFLAFVSEQSNGMPTTVTYVSGFQTALQLISVAIGLTVGLCTSLVVVHPVPSKRRAGGIFSL